MLTPKTPDPHPKLSSLLPVALSQLDSLEFLGESSQ
jgi:hypothetical protein